MFEKKQKTLEPVMEKAPLTVEQMKQRLIDRLPRAAEVGEPEPQTVLQEQDLVLQEEDFLQLEVDLVSAPPMFRSDEVLQRQRDPGFIRKSAKKAARKETAKRQAEQDAQRANAIRARITSMQTANGIDADTLVRRTCLETELGTYLNLPARQDVTGHDRRANEARYAKAKKVTKGMEAAAQTDVQNLVNNLRRDLALDGSDTLPDDLQQYADSFYFNYLYGEETIRDRKMRLEKDVDEGEITAEEEAERKKEIKKLEQFALTQKFYGTNAAPAMRTKLQTIRARKLALQQIRDEGSSLYHQRMAAILEKEIADLTVKYQYEMLMIRTCNDTPDSKCTQAQMEAIRRLAELRRRMKAPGVTEEEKAALEQEGQRIYKDYTYEDPADTGDNADKAADAAGSI